MSHSYGPPADRNEVVRASQIVAQAFLIEPEKVLKRIDLFETEQVRVFREGPDIAGCYWYIPMGQWFGGRSVPMAGVAAVGVPPENRGRAFALRMMEAAVKEFHERGYPLSALYPATIALYRGAGYEPAGSRFDLDIAPQAIGIKERALSVRAATEGDREAVRAAYRKTERRNGALERGNYIWHRIFSYREEPATGFLVEEGGTVTGYLYYVLRPTEIFGYNLMLTDIFAATPAAGRRLWTLLGSFGSMSKKITMFSGPGDPLLALLPEQTFRMQLQMYWSVRIVNVAQALEARGYPAGLRTEVALQISDPLIRENSGTFTLTVEGGSGKVTPGGRDAVSLHVNALAALFTGFQTPCDLKAAGGLASGSDAALERAEAVFAGSSPWMREMF